MKPRLLLPVVFTLALAAPVGCSSEPAAPADTTCPAVYSVSGAYVSGVTTLDVDGVKVEVWYPAEVTAAAGKAKAKYDMRDWLPAAERSKIPDADTPIFEMNAYRDLPAAKGKKFPIVAFSHGLGGYRMQSSVLMAHLATWGFVVVAPEHLERGLAIVLEGDNSKIDVSKGPDQLLAALTRIKKEGTTAGSRFEGIIDGSKVAAMGHSMGGAAAASIADQAQTVVLLASPGYGELPAGKSNLFMWGAADGVAKSSSIATSYEKQPSPRRSIGLKDAGHLAFTDLCAIGAERGGVLKIAADHGVAVAPLVEQLASDGCGNQPTGPAYLSPAAGWKIVNHFVTAHVRAGLGIDPAPLGLDQKTVGCFAPDVTTFETK